MFTPKHPEKPGDRSKNDVELAESGIDVPTAQQVDERGAPHSDVDSVLEHTLELREEQLIAHKELRELGEVSVRTEVDEVPGRMEVEAYREEIVIEHEPVGEVVSERDQPWEEDGVLVMPVYEEQLVVTKRLVLKERLRVRRVATTERQLFEDTLRREHLVIEDPQNTGLIREQYPTGDPSGEHSEEGGPAANHAADTEDKSGGGLLENLVRKALQ